MTNEEAIETIQKYFYFEFCMDKCEKCKYKPDDCPDKKVSEAKQMAIEALQRGGAYGNTARVL